MLGRSWASSSTYASSLQQKASRNHRFSSDPMSIPLSPRFSSTPRCVPQSNRTKSALKTSAGAPVQASPGRSETGVVVVGAGLAGLAAATRLHSDRIPFLLVEASDAVGGRVRTDNVDGYLLDRGFQIFITAYPEARKTLDYDALDLHKFYSGALVYYGGRFHRVADPFRHPSDALLSLANPIGSVLDKALIGLTRVRAMSRSYEEILSGDEVPISIHLSRMGFSDSVVDRFFRPFLGGIFFDRELETTSRLFDFIFKCLALGDNTLPAGGISAIPEQMAGKLPSGSIRLNSKVVSVDLSGHATCSPEVRLESGELLRGELGVIVAVEEPEAVRLLEGKIALKPPGKPPRSAACLYFSADRAPVRGPVLILNGSDVGIVNNMFFATEVARSYGPAGKTLVSVSVIGSREEVSEEELVRAAVEELSGWFGRGTAESWKHLRTYRIGFAQPNQSPPTEFVSGSLRVGSGVYVCGDFRGSATFDGALASGRKAAEALLEDVKVRLF